MSGFCVARGVAVHDIADSFYVLPCASSHLFVSSLNGLGEAEGGG